MSLRSFRKWLRGNTMQACQLLQSVMHQRPAWLSEPSALVWVQENEKEHSMKLRLSLVGVLFGPEAFASCPTSAKSKDENLTGAASRALSCISGNVSVELTNQCAQQDAQATFNEIAP